MGQQHDAKDELKAAYMARELKKAKRRVPMGSTGVFMQVALAMIFMYLIVISYSMMGIAGPVFVSILFLIALFMPVLYHVVKGVMAQRKAQAERIGNDAAAEVQQEG